ncbi:hypothetical protein ABL78_0003 [Leptomonas seymouri]|uniref:Uncharacterized protein n=1 Tax=Leptomonas seymouri TaxID=5684 RepID=A0A0N1PE27_LEPSE|nr:hypothetical protein ABL78_0003 [Leptomonas seymouri]|eukprot:KPI90770.1 hypothetical protein ABL78_0003 [Leptomonas seymouri]
MRRLAIHKPKWCKSLPSALLGTRCQASTKSSPYRKSGAAKAHRAPAHTAKTPRPFIEGEQGVADGALNLDTAHPTPSAQKLSSASSSGLLDILHYSADKVQQLANVFTGVSDEITLTTSKTAITGGCTLSSGAKNIEAQLRLPSHQTAKRFVRPRARESSRSRHLSAKRGASLAAEQRSKSRNTNAVLIQNWSSVLLSFTEVPATAKLVKDLLSVQTSLAPSQSPTDPCSSRLACTVSEHEILSTLLSASRLHWQITTHATASLLLSPSDAPPAEVLHILCVLASALEASVRSWREAEMVRAQRRNGAASAASRRGGATETQPRSHGMDEGEPGAMDAVQKLKECRRTCVTEYNHLFTELLTLMSTALTAYNGQQQDSSTDLPVRVDALLSAMISFLRIFDICTANAEEAFNAALCGKEKDISSGDVSAMMSIQSGLLQQLCVEASETAARMKSSPSSLTESSRFSSDELPLLQSYAATASSFRKQLINLQAKLKVLPRSAAGQSCVQGVISTVSVFCIAILREAIAVEVSAVHAAEPATSDDTREEDETCLQHQSVGLSSNEKVLLASHTGALLAMLHPQAHVPRAAQASLQYRTTSTALSVFLSSLWRYSAEVQSARSLRVRTSSHSASTDASGISTESKGNAPSSAALVSSASRFWEQHPAQVALLLKCHYDLLAVSSELLPVALGTASAQTSSSTTTDLSWVVPYFSRVVRNGMALQMDATLLAAAHLGLETAAPRSPDTPLEKVIASRLKSRRMKKSPSSATGRGDIGVARPAAGGSQGSADAPGELTSIGDQTCAKMEVLRDQWAQVLRLSGGVRVACCETLYRAVVGIAALCAEDRSAEARFLGSHRSAHAPQSSSSPAPLNSSSAHRTSHPAVGLIQAVSRLFFCIPRTEYLLGLYTDASLSAEAAVEQSRRVYVACSGVFLWLRELSPSFGSHFTSGAAAQVPPVPTDSAAAKDGVEAWLACGTTKSNALEAAFFLTYLLYHWPPLACAHHQQPLQPQPRRRGSTPCKDAHEHVSALMRVQFADGVAVAMSPTPVDFLISSTNAESYVAETLFFLQHDTASLLRHLRTTDRFHHFSGLKKDKTMLMEEEALQHRHVASTLAVVMAYQRQPTFVWMPLEAAQEIVFELRYFPGLLAPVVSETPTVAVTGLRREGEDVTVGHGESVVREYPNVRVGSITCTFVRAHGYLVRRLHVLSGILREYRSLLIQSSSPHDEEALPTASSPPGAGAPTLAEVEQLRGMEKTSAAPDSLSRHLSANARHSPQEERHRRNNYRWAHMWATMLREEFARLPAEMEGTPKWATGVLRTMERMELVMYDTHRQGLFFNVVRAQQEFQLQRRVQSHRMEQLPCSVTPSRAGDSDSDVELEALHETAENAKDQQIVREVRVTRVSTRTPIGVALDSNGCVLRVQQTVSTPVVGTAGEEPQVETEAKASYGDTEDVASPFAVALAHCSDGMIDPAEVIGRRIVAVDGVAVRSGREVAMQVKDKKMFVLTVEE